MHQEKSGPIRPSLGLAILIFVLVVSILIIGLLVFGGDVHVLLFLCVSAACIFGIILKNTWQSLQDGMCMALNRAMQAILFFFLIGMIIGSWIQSGTVPALIYYGLDLLSPRFFLPAGLLLCSLVSLATGSSWNTAGTVGVALMGIGAGMGVPAPVTAGMVVSGAYFGDKMSPLSDTTNLAPIMSGTVLYEHIKAMMYTAIPVYVLTLLIFTAMGWGYGDLSIDQSQILLYRDGLSGVFNLNLITLLPVVIVLVLSLCRFPALPGLAVGVVSSLPIAVYCQGMSWSDALLGLNYGYFGESGIEVIDTLLNNGGIQSMMWTLSMTMLALCLGGVLSSIKVLDVIVQAISHKVKTVRAYPALAILTSSLTNVTMGDQYMSLVISGELYRDTFPEKGLQPRMLSRCLEEGGTVTSAIVPWSSCGAIMFGALGISAFEYAPYAIFNWLTPLFGIIVTLCGFTILTRYHTSPWKPLTNKSLAAAKAAYEAAHPEEADSAEQAAS